MAGLLRATANVGGMTLLSRILGFVRDIIIARMLGAGAGADAFFVAFRIPNLLRRLFGEGAFAQAFVPVLSEYKTQRSEQEVRGLVDAVAGTLGGALVLVSTVGILVAPVLVMLFAPGFLGQHEKYALATEMLRITFPYILFVSLTAFAGAILNSYGRFGVPAFTPVLLNLSLIGAAIWLSPHLAEPATGLAWGVLIGGVAQLLFQWPFLRRLRLVPRPRVRPRDAGVRRILRLMGPAIFGSSVAQINVLFDTLIASFLVTGSVSWLYYSDRLLEFPLGVFGIALATVVLPTLSRNHAASSPEEFSRTLDWALRWVVLIGVPASLGLITLAGPMIATLFHYGEFTGEDVRMTARSLIAYAVGLVPFILVKVLAPGFYARQDTRRPVRAAVIAMVTNMVLNLILVFPLAHAGLALATSLSAALNAGLLFLWLHREEIRVLRPQARIFLVRVVVAGAVMAAVVALGAPRLSTWLTWDAGERAWALLRWVIIGGTTYILMLGLLGMRLRHLREHA